MVCSSVAGMARNGELFAGVSKTVCAWFDTDDSDDNWSLPMRSGLGAFTRPPP
jgi:hypothetical protein